MLTSETLTPFIGGDLEIGFFEGSLSVPNKVIRGPIERVEQEGLRVVVQLEWAACLEMPKPARWMASEVTRHKLPEIFGGEKPDSEGRLLFLTDSLSILFIPPGGGSLDRAKVQGLK